MAMKQDDNWNYDVRLKAIWNVSTTSYIFWMHTHLMVTSDTEAMYTTKKVADTVANQ